MIRDTAADNGRVFRGPAACLDDDRTQTSGLRACRWLVSEKLWRFVDRRVRDNVLRGHGSEPGSRGQTSIVSPITRREVTLGIFGSGTASAQGILQCPSCVPVSSSSVLHIVEMLQLEQQLGSSWPSCSLQSTSAICMQTEVLLQHQVDRSNGRHFRLWLATAQAIGSRHGASGRICMGEPPSPKRKL